MKRRQGSFVLHGNKVGITEIVDMWIEEELKDKKRKRFFKVKGSDGILYEIYMNEKTQEWFIRRIFL
jgi:glycerol dehydrogenase-like iron-containing ADH family enzyme